MYPSLIYWGKLQKKAKEVAFVGNFVMYLILTLFPLYDGGGVDSIFFNKKSLSSDVGIFFLSLKSKKEKKLFNVTVFLI